MEFGKLYGVGVGPGDKELITLKAARIIKEADVIAVPKVKNSTTAAFDIIKEFIGNKKILYCSMPMSKDSKENEYHYVKISDNIENELKNGLNVAFATLGDPTLYSTYIHIHRLISQRGYECEIIPGITSVCAAAAKLDISLCERDEPLFIIPASCQNIKDIINLDGTKVIMKLPEDNQKTIDLIEDLNLAKKSVIIEKCTMHGEKIYKNISHAKNKIGYFSLVLIKENTD